MSEMPIREMPIRAIYRAGEDLYVEDFCGDLFRLSHMGKDAASAFSVRFRFQWIFPKRWLEECRTVITVRDPASLGRLVSIRTASRRLGVPLRQIEGRLQDLPGVLEVDGERMVREAALETIGKLVGE